METTTCEHEIEAGWKFCPYCGEEIVNQRGNPNYDPGDYPDGFNPQLYDLEEPR